VRLTSSPTQTLRTPHHHATGLITVIGTPVQPPPRLNPELSPNLQEIIKTALEKDRSLRYQWAAEMRTNLQWLALVPYMVTAPNRAPPIKTSSRCGKTPTPDIPIFEQAKSEYAKCSDFCLNAAWVRKFPTSRNKRIQNKMVGAKEGNGPKEKRAREARPF
jgi:hypothetical protein